MKKNIKLGFTLAELLGVIVILGLLFLLVFPNVIRQMQAGKNKIDDAVLKLIFNSTDNYMKNHLDEYQTASDRTYCITLQQLVSEHEIASTMLIDSEGEPLDLNQKVEVTIKDSKKNYKMNENCKE